MKETVFKGIVVTNRVIVKTIGDFESQYPNTNACDSWLDKNTYKYAVEYRGKCHPPKYILSQATEISILDFNGGQETNRVFQQ